MPGGNRGILKQASLVGRATVASQSASFWQIEMLWWGSGVIGAIRSMLGTSTFRRVKAALVVLAAVMTVTIAAGTIQTTAAFAQGSGVIRDIRVVGSKRIEPETVKSYLTFTAGQRYDPYKADESLRALFATGLFQDVRINNEGGVVVISVVEIRSSTGLPSRAIRKSRAIP